MSEPSPLPSAGELVAKMDSAIAGGRDTDVPACIGLVMDLVVSNLRQWDLENTTRDAGASDAIVANAKREIDRLNMGRHHLVQDIDAAIDAQLDQRDDAPVATESPGMVLDRLSVLVIRRARTADAASKDPGYGDRLAALDAQVELLSSGLDNLMDDLRAGTRRCVPYEHFKLYEQTSEAGTRPG